LDTEAIRSRQGNEDVSDWKIIRSKIKKNIVSKSVLPDEVEKFLWAGHFIIGEFQLILLYKFRRLK
jgi:hypothetical protein